MSLEEVEIVVDEKGVDLRAVQPLPNQAAGHAGTIFRLPAAPAENLPARVLKPVPQREAAFYAAIRLRPEWRAFVPRAYAVHRTVGHASAQESSSDSAQQRERKDEQGPGKASDDGQKQQEQAQVRDKASDKGKQSQATLCSSADNQNQQELPSREDKQSRSTGESDSRDDNPSAEPVLLVHSAAEADDAAHTVSVPHALERWPYLLELADCSAWARAAAVADVKIGRCSAGEDASAAKRARMEAHDAQSTSAPLALRLCGVRRGSLVRGKAWGKALAAREFDAGLALFFDFGSVQSRQYARRVLRAFRRRARALLAFMRSQREFRFYSSSLLLVYDLEVCTFFSYCSFICMAGLINSFIFVQPLVDNQEHCADDFATYEESQPSQSDNGEVRKSADDDDDSADNDSDDVRVELRMIDHAHVYAYRDDSVGDNGYAFGLENLIKSLRNIEQQYC